MNGRIFFAAACVAFGFALGAEQLPASRYKSILERMPFGPEPEGFDPTKPPSEQKLAANAVGADGLTEEQRAAEAEKVLASVKVSVINVTPDGRTAVGFTDTSVNPPVNYYLYVGEERNGWKVVAANVAAEGRDTTLSRDGVEATVKLGEGTGGAAAKGRGGAPANGMRNGRTVMAGRRSNLLSAPQAAGAPQSPMSRLQLRRLKHQQDEADKTAAAAKAAEERRQREAEEKERRALEAEERAQQLQALQTIRDEIKKDREARAAEKAKRETEANKESGE